jgi:hypothetical protein
MKCGPRNGPGRNWNFLAALPHSPAATGTSDLVVEFKEFARVSQAPLPFPPACIWLTPEGRARPLSEDSDHESGYASQTPLSHPGKRFSRPPLLPHYARTAIPSLVSCAGIFAETGGCCLGMTRSKATCLSPLTYACCRSIACRVRPVGNRSATRASTSGIAFVTQPGS